MPQQRRASRLVEGLFHDMIQNYQRRKNLKQFGLQPHQDSFVGHQNAILTHPELSPTEKREALKHNYYTHLHQIATHIATKNGGDYPHAWQTARRVFGPAREESPL